MECINPFEKTKDIYMDEEEEKGWRMLKVYHDNYQNNTNKRGSGAELVSPL